MTLGMGARLGPYEILAAIGAGGMGEVYRARDTRLHRDVAIKILPAEIRDDPRLRTRFEREARAVAALNHPHVVTVYDVGESEGTIYIAFELIHGETLQERMARRRLLLPEAVHLAAQMASGLAHAHEAGVVHRDLKPRNVMVTPEGLIKILDFGLGKFVDVTGAAQDAATTTTALSHRGMVVGTVGYMAPEQVYGGTVDARSDQFVFGVVLYEMLTGTRAFQKDTAVQTLSAIIEDEPAPLVTLAPGVPAALVTLVTTCLAKRPGERYEATRALLIELQAIETALLDDARPPARRPIRRGLVFIGVTATVLVALTGSVWRGWVSPATPPASKPSSVATLALLPIESQDPDPAERAYWNGLTQVVAARLGALPAGRQVHVTPAPDVTARRVRTPDDARVELGASHVLRGVANEEGGQLHARIELVEVASKRVVRTSDVVVSRENRSVLPNRLLDAVLTMIEVSLTQSERTSLAAPATSPEAGDFYLQGLGYLQDDSKPENADTAVALFEHAIALDAKYASSYAGLGEAYWRKYQSTRDAKWADTARQTCERALGVDEREAAPHRCLGTVANGVGDYEKAVEEYQHALAREPDSELARIGLANAYDRLGLANRAEEAYLEAIRIRPRYWNGYSRLGAFYYAQRRYADAERTFRQVVTLHPDSWRGYSNLGALFYVQGRTQEAIAAYQQSLSIRPNYQAASNLGTLYFFDLGDYARATQAFRQAVTLNENEYVVWGNLASALFWSGQRAEALTDYAKAAALAERRLTVNPRDASVMMTLAEDVAELGQLDRARTLMDQALSLAPGDARLMFQAGVLYEYRLQNRDKAFEWLGRALAAGYQWKEVERSPALAALRQDARIDRLRGRATTAAESGKKGA
jgi:serine/threonine-protein kinase